MHMIHWVTPAVPPNTPPNQASNLPAPQQPPNQPATPQPPPHQPVSQQPPQQQPVPASPAGPLQPVPNWPQPLLCQPAPQIIHQQMVKWSHFKPKFAGKPEEDAEAHLLSTNDWMWTHNFEENVKVDGFCLTLLGEVRLWYETLNPDAIDWLVLQNALKRQYSNLGNTPEQYFHQWRSFYFDENTGNIDSYVTRVSQCATMLNYGEPQILELMKNTLPSRLYPILFAIDNLKDAITTAKWVMIKEKIDKRQANHLPLYLCK